MNIPTDELDKGVVEGNSGLSIEGGGSGIALEVLADHIIFSVVKDALHFGLGSLLDGLLDLLI